MKVSELSLSSHVLPSGLAKTHTAPLNAPCVGRDAANIFARLQTGLVTLSGYSQRKLRLELAPSQSRTVAKRLSEVIPFWFAISSPLIGVLLGFLGAWLVTLLTA